MNLTYCSINSDTALAARDRARLLMMARHRTFRKRQQSLLSRTAAEIGLAEAVSA